MDFNFNGTPAQLRHGDVVIAAITSCTNTSNPSVMLGAALVAKKACELGLEVGCPHFWLLLHVHLYCFPNIKEMNEDNNLLDSIKNWIKLQ